jgi:hypothetical protein
MQELLKSYEETDPRYAKTNLAYEAIQGCVNRVNENKRAVDNILDIIAIQELFDKPINLQAKGRQLLFVNDFRKIYLNSTGCKSTLWLFNDLILIGKKKDKFFQVRTRVPTNNCVVWDLDPNDSPSCK